MRIGRWFEHRFVFFCQLVEIIREADIWGGWLGVGSLVVESQLRIPKFEPEIRQSNILPLVSVIRCSRDGMEPPAQLLAGFM